MQKLSIRKCLHANTRQDPATGERRAESSSGSCSELRDDILLCIHTADAFFMFRTREAFLTFNFKSVYSAAVLRADKIS